MCWGKMLSWTWLSGLRGAAAVDFSEYRACKLFTLARANMRCWVQTPSQRMMKVSKYQGQKCEASLQHFEKRVPERVPDNPKTKIY